MVNERRKKTLFLVQFSMLLAIEAIVCFTKLGSIPVGPLVATLGMIPVIIAGIVLGPKAGALLGFFAGLFSFLVWTFMPPNPATAFVFTPFYSLGEIKGSIWSLVICFVPRILVGLVAAYSYRLIRRLADKKKGLDVVAYTVGGILGSMINTILVLGGIYLFFGKDYALALDVKYTALLAMIGTTILTNGLFEAAVSAVSAYAIGKPLNIINRRNL